MLRYCCEFHWFFKSPISLRNIRCKFISSANRFLLLKLSKPPVTRRFSFWSIIEDPNKWIWNTRDEGLKCFFLLEFGNNFEWLSHSQTSLFFHFEKKRDYLTCKDANSAKWDKNPYCNGWHICSEFLLSFREKLTRNPSYRYELIVNFEILTFITLCSHSRMWFRAKRP